ncbi:MAG: hypothetical protein ABL886_02400 [Rhodoglobus sp.]
MPPQPPEPPTCLYGLVKMVRVNDVTDQEIRFSSRSSTDDYESFVVPLGEVLVDPPTDAPTAVPLTPGAIGYLYLSRDGWKAQSSTGATLYKAGDKDYVLLKWPLCRPYRLLGDLRVTPTKITVEGLNVATGTPVTIDLLGGDAGPAQDIDWRAAAPIIVKLSDAGAAANGDQPLLMVWPKRIVVNAASVKKKHISATLDVLDVQYGDFNQHLKWSERGAPIDLRLSTTGFGLFKVTPNAIAYYAAGLRVTYPEEIVRECGYLDNVNEPDVRDHIRRARERGATDAERVGGTPAPAVKKPKTSATEALRSPASPSRGSRPRRGPGRS